MDIPEQFLGKIAQRLSRAGILRITQGARGGYQLVQEPAALSLLAVVEAAEGELCLNQCLRDPKACTRSCSCSVHQVWVRARQALRLSLSGITFAGLASAEAACLPALPRAGEGPRANRTTGRR
jgi:Rrf2 family protein